MPKIIYVYQKQEQMITNIQIMKIHLKKLVKNCGSTNLLVIQERVKKKIIDKFITS